MIRGYLKFRPGDLIKISGFPPVVFVITEVHLVSEAYSSPVYKLVSDEVVELASRRTYYRIYYACENEVQIIAPSLQEVPLEDWASLIHLLHPQLQHRVRQWIQSFDPVI